MLRQNRQLHLHPHPVGWHGDDRARGVLDHTIVEQEIRWVEDAEPVDQRANTDRGQRWLGWAASPPPWGRSLGRKS